MLQSQPGVRAGLGFQQALVYLQGTSKSIDKGEGRWKLGHLSSVIFGEAKNY